MAAKKPGKRAVRPAPRRAITGVYKLGPLNPAALKKLPPLREVIDPPPTRWARASVPKPRGILFVVGKVPIELVQLGAVVYALHANGKPLKLSGAVRVEFADSYIRVHQIDGKVGALGCLAYLAGAATPISAPRSRTRARFEVDSTVSASIHNTWGYTHLTGVVEIDLVAHAARIELEDYVSV